MKLAKTLASALIAAASSLTANHTLAFTPPYHIDTALVGKASIQSSGSCKIRQTYENARYGEVYDATDSHIGIGIISASGWELLVAAPNATLMSMTSDTATNKTTYVSFVDFASAETAATLQLLAGCTVNRLVSNAKTRVAFTTEPTGYSVTLSYPFNGISPPIDASKGTKTILKAQNFSGKITFKGNAPIP